MKEGRFFRGLTLSFASLLLLATTVLLVSGCRKKGDESAPEAITATTKQDYKLYEMVTVRVANTLAPGQVIDAMAGDRPAKIAAVNDSTMVFVAVPEIYSIGPNILSFEADGLHEIAFNILPSTPVENATVALTEFVAGQTNEISLLEALMSADTSTAFQTTGVSDAIVQSRKMNEDLQSVILGMSPQDQIIMANYLAANKPAFDEMNRKLGSLGNFLVNGNHGLAKTTFLEICTTGTPVERYRCHWVALGQQLREFVVMGSMSAIALSTIPVTGLAGLAVGAVAGALAAPSGVAVVMISAKLVYIHFKIAYLMVFDETREGKLKTTAAPVEVLRDTNVLLPIKMSLRNVQSEDVGSQLGWLSAGARAVAAYNTFWSQLGINKFKFNYGQERGKLFTPFDMAHIEVRVSGNSKVSLESFGGTTEAPFIKITSTDTAEQLFVINVTYDDGVNNPVTFPVDAKLVRQLRPSYWYAGKYTLYRDSSNSFIVNCGTQYGAQGDVFFYVSPTKIVTFARNIIPGLPENMKSITGALYQNPFRNVNSTNYEVSGTWYHKVFELEYLSIYPGDSISSYLAHGFLDQGYAYWTVPPGDPSICPAYQGGNYKFSYRIRTHASFRGEDPPAELSPAEVKEMMEL